MKNLLKKLHMMPNQSEDVNGSTSSRGSRLGDVSIEKVSPSRSSPSHSEQKTFSNVSGWLNSVTNRHSPSPPSSSNVRRGDKWEPPPDSLSNSGLDAVLDTIRQESESSNSRDPEAVQIEAVKHISLDSCPPQNTPAEVVAYRYWNYNALSYDDKILDGFYDLYGIWAESTSEKMPSLVDLQGTPVSDAISWEAVLVNRVADVNLMKLEQKALVMTVQSRSGSLGYIERDLVRKLAALVADDMGGPVGNLESMLKSYRELSNTLRATLNSMVLPLGYLTIGLGRHRALLFKVLADSVGLPCRLMKGQQYTGSDDVALNIVRVDDGREYIVDLMADPGTLIPSDAAGLQIEYEQPFFAVSRDFDEPQEKSPEKGANGSPSSMGMFLGELERKKMQQYSSGELARITENFTNQIGSGAYGDVFKGKFPNGVQVAVKKLRNIAVNVMEYTFMAEVRTMSSALHRHLVRLFGYCFEVNMKALVYEYLENGSLDKVLYENHLNLQWESLYEIAIGTAKGLSYLHEGCDEVIIHYDVKPANVLLDSKLFPKVADFGMAKISQRDLSHISVIEFRGTRSYAAPEMWMQMPGTPKSDTYSFGMMLFEILGKRRISDGQNWFPGLVWENFKKGQMDEIMEYCGIKDEDKVKAEILCTTALWCTQYRPDDRPTMSDVVKVLEGNIQLPSPPDPFYPYSVFSGKSILGGTSTKISGPHRSRVD